MASHVRGAITIGATPEKVWGVLADFGGVDRWAPLVRRSYLVTTDPVVGVGTVRRCESPVLGRVEERVVEWNDGTDFSYAVQDVGPLRRTVVKFAVDRSNDRSRVSVNADLQMRAGLFWSLLVVGVWPVTLITMQLGLWGLKRYVESPRRKSKEGSE